MRRNWIAVTFGAVALIGWVCVDISSLPIGAIRGFLFGICFALAWISGNEWRDR